MVICEVAGPEAWQDITREIVRTRGHGCRQPVVIVTVDNVERQVRNQPFKLIRCVVARELLQGKFVPNNVKNENQAHCYLAPHRGRARYCNAHVCLFVCLCVCLSVFSQNFVILPFLNRSL